VAGEMFVALAVFADEKTMDTVSWFKSSPTLFVLGTDMKMLGV
jgi:hypothetical protein